MTAPRGRFIRRDAEVEVHLKHAGGLARPFGIKRLRDAISVGARRHARADSAERVKILERTLRIRAHGDLPLVNPRRHEHALAATSGGGLHLEIAIEVIQRTQHRRGCRLLLPFQIPSQRGDACIERAPFGLRFLRGQQRNQRARFLLLLRTGERVAGALEDAVERVVIVHRDRVELVRVTPRTAERQAENGLAQRVDGVLNGEVMIVLRVEPKAPRNREVTGGRHPLSVTRARSSARENVARDLLTKKFVVGLVGVERVDDVIAIAPGVRHGIVGGLARRVRVTHEVEPVPSPALAVMRRGEQTFNDCREGIRKRVALERVCFLGRGGKSDEIVAGAAQQGAFIGGCGKAPFTQLRANESIDGRSHRRPIAHRHHWTLHWLKRPMIGRRCSSNHLSRQKRSGERQNRTQLPTPGGQTDECRASNLRDDVTWNDHSQPRLFKSVLRNG